MQLNLENFVEEEKIKRIAKDLIDSDHDVKAFNLLKELTTPGELRKLRAFIKCQRRDISNNFTAMAIWTSTFALLLPALEKIFNNNPIVYIVICSSVALGLGYPILKDGVPFINRTNERNSKIEYILTLVNRRGD